MESFDEANELVRNITVYFDRFVPGLKRLRDSLRAGQGSEDEIADACEGFVWLSEAISKLSDRIGYEPDGAAVTQIMKSLQHGIETKDYSYAADALEFDALPLAEAWKTIIETVTVSAKA